MQMNTSRFSRAGYARLAIAATAMVLASTATAGPLPTDPNAMVGWQNSVPFTGTGPGTSFTGRVEYAVYAPGSNFSASAALSTISPLSNPPDPSSGTDYVYAYEIFTDSTSLQSINLLSIGLNLNAVPNNTTRVGNYTNTALLGVLPILSQFNPLAVFPKSNVKWFFTPSPNGLVIAGSHSDILYFTSPNGPTTIASTLAGLSNTIVNNVILPTPVPEPASLALASLAAASVLLFRSFRRRVA